MVDTITGHRIFGFPILNGKASRISELADMLQISAIPKGGKPFTFAFKRALKHIDGNEENTIMIGDQVFTDIWGGNLIGLYTILVNPISTKEFWGTNKPFFRKIISK